MNQGMVWLVQQSWILACVAEFVVPLSQRSRSLSNESTAPRSPEVQLKEFNGNEAWLVLHSIQLTCLPLDCIHEQYIVEK